MKIVMTGGGSGGHITPILAVADEVKRVEPDAEIIYIGQYGEALLDVLEADPNLTAIYTVRAGKLRRYSGEGWKQLLDLKTQALNIRDLFRVIIGIVQSYRLLKKLKPDVIFTRGGFVSVPVALAGKLCNIPYITHDSDSIPSLANRIIARWAHSHAVSMPTEIYPYPSAKTVMTGIPLNTHYTSVSNELCTSYRKELGLSGYKQIIFLTGGGNGAQRLNQDMVANARFLLSNYPDLCIVHVAGRALESETTGAYDSLELGTARSRIKVMGFVDKLYRYSGAADIIVNRGTATNLAEFATQGRACVAVPSDLLGWNVKNVQILAERKALVALTESQAEQPERLGRVIGQLLDNDDERRTLGRELSKLGRPDAAFRLANLLLAIARGEQNAFEKK